MLRRTTRENQTSWWKGFKHIFADIWTCHCGEVVGCNHFGSLGLTSQICKDPDWTCLAQIDLKHTCLEGMTFSYAYVFSPPYGLVSSCLVPALMLGVRSCWSPTTQGSRQCPEIEDQKESSRVEEYCDLSPWCTLTLIGLSSWSI